MISTNSLRGSKTGESRCRRRCSRLVVPARKARFSASSSRNRHASEQQPDGGDEVAAGNRLGRLAFERGGIARRTRKSRGQAALLPGPAHGPDDRISDMEHEQDEECRQTEGDRPAQPAGKARQGVKQPLKRREDPAEEAQQQFEKGEPRIGLRIQLIVGTAEDLLRRPANRFWIGQRRSGWHRAHRIVPALSPLWSCTAGEIGGCLRPRPTGPAATGRIARACSGRKSKTQRMPPTRRSSTLPRRPRRTTTRTCGWGIRPAAKTIPALMSPISSPNTKKVPILPAINCLLRFMAANPATPSMTTTCVARANQNAARIPGTTQRIMPPMMARPTRIQVQMSGRIR